MTAKFIVADVFDGLASLETGSVDLVVTSPPFLALRSYLPADHELKSKEIGSEATPAEFIDTLLKVTAELRRVLAPHGSICVELGDTYAGPQPPYRFTTDHTPTGSMRRTNAGTINSVMGEDNIRGRVGEGWPLAKSRTLIPSLYQIALAYGFNPLTGQPSPARQWRVRNIVTWARPNPPVGALGDKWRPATSDLVVACTSGKRYWDDLATRKPPSADSLRNEGTNVPTYKQRYNDMDNGVGPKAMPTYLASAPGGAPLLDYWVIPLLEGEEEKPYGPAPQPKNHARIAKGAEPRTDLPSQQRDGNWNTLPQQNDDPDSPGAPLLDYWVIPPGGYQGSHYAVFPEELVVPCVQAMCPQKVCRVCGEPSRRITETTNAVGKAVGRRSWMDSTDGIGAGHIGEIDVQANHHSIPDSAEKVTLGWSDCGHDSWRPGLVLDPFAGSGTTLAVATGHGHDAIGIDIDSRNAVLARDRVGPFLFEMVDA